MAISVWSQLDTAAACPAQSPLDVPEYSITELMPHATDAERADTAHAQPHPVRQLLLCQTGRQGIDQANPSRIAARLLPINVLDLRGP